MLKGGDITVGAEYIIGGNPENSVYSNLVFM